MNAVAAGVAAVKSSGNIVVVDDERRTVTVHAPSTRPPSPGVPLCTIHSDQLGNPTHVAVDNNGMMFISDALHLCVKVTDPFVLFITSARIVQCSCTQSKSVFLNMATELGTSNRKATRSQNTTFQIITNTLFVDSMMLVEDWLFLLTKDVSKTGKIYFSRKLPGGCL